MRTRTTSQLAPARRTSSANDSSERTRPGVVPSDTSAMSGGPAKGREGNLAGVAKPAATVVVPTANRAGYLEVTLGSLARQRLDRPYEVIVVDDASSDRTPAVIASARVRSIRHDTPRGPNAGRNEAIETAEADLIAMVDDDTRVPPGWLAAMVGGAERHPDADAFGGPIRAR